MPATPENDKAITAQIVCAIIPHIGPSDLLEEKPVDKQINLEALWSRVLTMVSTGKAPAPL